MSKIVSLTIMWLAWPGLAMLSLLEAYFCTQRTANLDSFARPIGIPEVGLFMFGIILCGTLRFWLARTRHPLVALIPYLLGIIFAWFTAMFGVFLVPEYFLVFQVLSVALFALYFPLFVRFRARIPPPVKSEAR